MDITTIPLQELLDDKRESIRDIGVCELALIQGVTTYSGGSVRRRLEVNQQIVAKIDAELNRREKASVIVVRAAPEAGA